jgi:DNA-binding NtrC family response regulator
LLEICHTLAIRSVVSYTASRSAFVTNVLIVSAYADFRDIYTFGLRHEGLWAEAIESPSEAEAVLRRMRPDAITFHLGHDESGWTDCAFLLKMAQPAPVILLTGWVHPDGRTARKAFELGCAAFVIEPCVPDDLASIIERVITGERGINWHRP